MVGIGREADDSSLFHVVDNALNVLPIAAHVACEPGDRPRTVRVTMAPCALLLAHKAGAGEFDRAFYAAQTLEFAAGAANIALLALNMRDGLRLTRGG